MVTSINLRLSLLYIAWLSQVACDVLTMIVIYLPVLFEITELSLPLYLLLLPLTVVILYSVEAGRKSSLCFLMSWLLWPFIGTNMLLLLDDVMKVKRFWFLCWLLKIKRSRKILMIFHRVLPWDNNPYFSMFRIIIAHRIVILHHLRKIEHSNVHLIVTLFFHRQEVHIVIQIMMFS